MEFTKDQLRPDPPGGADEVSARVTEICTAWEKPAARSVRGGVASALGDGELATVASGQQEPGLATALATLLAEPGMLAAVQLIMSEEDTAKAVKMMAKMAGDKSTGPSFSVLPGGADAIAVAWKIVTGDIGQIDLKSPFDETVTETFAGLQAELVSAVQQGVQVAEAWKIMVDPYFQELGRKWREVTRLAGARPVLGLVAKEVLATAAVKALREHAASCTPVVQVSAADVRKLRSDVQVRVSVHQLGAARAPAVNSGRGGGCGRPHGRW
mmetsp:Transcript_33904/g.80575  ORF Transcript_33904/g.80575 Transcript_33904/m.80575 type:complete len:270 (-) Transcript_33904:780-1589(-)